jgi:hypothetical protein
LLQIVTVGYIAVTDGVAMPPQERVTLNNNGPEERQMGIAKHRAVAHAHIQDRVDISRLSSAIRKLATVASDRLGADCFVHAAIIREILGEMGVVAKLVGGYTAWRLGSGDSDVILHAPMPGMVIPEKALPFHVWLEVEGHLYDVTTYQLRLKAQQMDAQDGGKTNVEWCPDYLYVPKSSISPLIDVVQKNAGMYYYERNQDIERRVIETAPEPDAEDVNNVWLLYQNPDCKVRGLMSEKMQPVE